MIELEQCSFCNGQTEIVTLSCSSGGTPCYCFRCTKCGGIRRFGTLNPADICRECEVRQKIMELEKAGDRTIALVLEVSDPLTLDRRVWNAIEEWIKIRRQWNE